MWSRRPEDELVSMGTATSVGQLSQELKVAVDILRGHIDRHRWWNRAALLVAGGAGALLSWGAGQFRDATTEAAKAQSLEATRQQVTEARAEHGELRTADRRLAEDVTRLDRELQKVAMRKLELVREARPK